MKPYGIKKYPIAPDVADCRDYALQSSVSSLRGKSGEHRGLRSVRKSRAKTRRHFKRVARQEGRRCCQEIS